MAPFEDKGKSQKLRTPVGGSGSLLDHSKISESEEVRNDYIKKKNNSAINSQPTAVIEKNVIDTEIRWCLKVVKSKFSQ